MKRINRIKSNIRISALMSGIIITMIEYGIILLVWRNYGSTVLYRDALKVAAGILLANIVIAIVYGLCRTAGISKRMRRCKGATSIDHETFERIAKEIVVGDEWLIWYHNNEYLFWTKQVIRSIEVVKGKDLYTKGNVVIRSIMNPNGEAISFSESTKENLEYLVNWIA